MFFNVLAGFFNLGKSEKNRGNSDRFSEKSKCLKKKKRKEKENFLPFTYAGRSPRVHEVNPGRGPSICHMLTQLLLMLDL